MMTAVMTHVVLALGVAAVAALVVVILIAIATSRGLQPVRTVRTPGVARTSGTRKPPPPETAGLHLLDLD